MFLVAVFMVVKMGMNFKTIMLIERKKMVHSIFIQLYASSKTEMTIKAGSTLGVGWCQMLNVEWIVQSV